MATINYNNILLELLNELRSADILSITERGLATKTDSFTAAGGAQTFTLTETSCKNVRWVKQAGVSLSYGTDYAFTYSASKNISAVVVSKSLTLGAKITISYDYGTGDKIYPDFARPYISISSFPRISFNYINGDTEVIAVDGVQAFSPLMQFTIYDYGVEALHTKMTNLRQFIKNKQQGLYYSNILRIVGGRPYELIREEGKNKIYKMDLDVKNELNIER